MLAMVSRLAAPVSCSAIRKSDAVRTPLARPLGRSSTVGLPAPVASAMWSKPMRERAGVVERAAEAHAAVQREAVAPLEQQADHLEEVLVPAHGDAVFGHAAEAGHQAVVERLDEVAHVANRRERHALAANGDARHRRVERLDLQAVDADHRVAVVDEIVREREAGRPHADDQHALAGGRRGTGAGAG